LFFYSNERIELPGHGKECKLQVTYDTMIFHDISCPANEPKSNAVLPEKPLLDIPGCFFEGFIGFHFLSPENFAPGPRWQRNGWNGDGRHGRYGHGATWRSWWHGRYGRYGSEPQEKSLAKSRESSRE